MVISRMSPITICCNIVSLGVIKAATLQGNGCARDVMRRNCSSFDRNNSILGPRGSASALSCDRHYTDTSCTIHVCLGSTCSSLVRGSQHISQLAY